MTAACALQVCTVHRGLRRQRHVEMRHPLAGLTSTSQARVIMGLGMGLSGVSPHNLPWICLARLAMLPDAFQSHLRSRRKTPEEDRPSPTSAMSQITSSLTHLITSSLSQPSSMSSCRAGVCPTSFQITWMKFAAQMCISYNVVSLKKPIQLCQIALRAGLFMQSTLLVMHRQTGVVSCQWWTQPHQLPTTVLLRPQPVALHGTHQMRLLSTALPASWRTLTAQNGNLHMGLFPTGPGTELCLPAHLLKAQPGALPRGLLAAGLCGMPHQSTALPGGHLTGLLETALTVVHQSAQAALLLHLQHCLMVIFIFTLISQSQLNGLGALSMSPSGTFQNLSQLQQQGLLMTALT